MSQREGRGLQVAFPKQRQATKGLRVLTFEVKKGKPKNKSYAKTVLRKS